MGRNKVDEKLKNSKNTHQRIYHINTITRESSYLPNQNTIIYFYTPFTHYVNHYTRHRTPTYVS